MADMREVRIEDVDESALNPRTNFGDLTELVDSVKRRGVLEPLVVRQRGARYEIVCGARRYRAACAARLTHLPVTVQAVVDRDVIELALIENDSNKRHPLHPLDEGEAVYRLVREFGLTVGDVAKRTSKTERQLRRRLELALMQSELKKMLRDNRISLAVAQVFAALTDTAQVDLLRSYANELDNIDREKAVRIASQRYGNKLEFARFDVTIPLAGAPACSKCPKRSSAQLDLFEQSVPETCLDEICYGAKSRAAFDLMRESHPEAKVFAGADARAILNADDTPKDAYVLALGPCPYAERSSWRDTLRKRAPDLLIVETSRGAGLLLYRRREAEQAFAAKGERFAKMLPVPSPTEEGSPGILPTGEPPPPKAPPTVADLLLRLAAAVVASKPRSVFAAGPNVSSIEDPHALAKRVRKMAPEEAFVFAAETLLERVPSVAKFIGRLPKAGKRKAK